MSLRAATPTLARKAVPPRKPAGPTDAQTRALDALMREAQAPGELWQWSLSTDSGLVACSRWRGPALVARAIYSSEEVARMGDAWPAEVMARLSDSWAPEFVRGVR